MATENTTSKASIALAMATEIAEQDNRLFSLASAIRDQLAQELGEDKSSSHAFGLTELLCELMSDSAQSILLRECLGTMQESK